MVYGSPEYAQLLKEIIKDGLRHDLYQLTVDHAKEMGVHINGDKPMYLLERIRPREDSEVKAYRIQNYEPTTKAGADKAMDIVSKVCNPLLSSIAWKEHNTDSRKLEEYTMEYYPGYNSILNFNKEVTLKKMLADPNGVLAVKPMDIPETDTEELEPVVVTYGSRNIWYHDRDHFLICIREASKEDKDQWYEFEYYDKTRFINFQARYEESNKEIQIVENAVYAYTIGEIPVWFLGGKSRPLDNGRIMFESYFSSALPHWNLAIIHESDLLGAYINHLHPQKYELAEECAFKLTHDGMQYPCRGGFITYPGGKDGETIRQACDRCGGTGLTSVKSPYGAYQFTRSKLEEGQPSGLLPVGYITIPTEATKMLEERCEKMIQKGMWSINMDIEEKIGENQSGVAKAIDRSAQNDTLFTIGSRVFDVHLANQFFYINKMMFGVRSRATRKEDDKNLPEISKPTKFDTLTTAELINNFEVVKKSGMDRNVLRVKSIEIINSDMGSTPALKNYLISLIELDPLFGYESEDIDLGVTKGVIRKVDWAIHANIKSFVDRAIEQDKSFLEKPRSEQITVLNQFAQELIATEQPRLDERSIFERFDSQDQNAA